MCFFGKGESRLEMEQSLGHGDDLGIETFNGITGDICELHML